MHTAFSTIACPDWTLDRAVAFAAEAGFDGLELRTFGHHGSPLLCEPCLTGPTKIRDLFEDEGVRPAALATSIRYDAPVVPPILGRVFGDFEKPVRQTKQMVEVATSIEAPYVRVFPFELPEGESRRSGVRRIVERLTLAATTARHTGVRLLLENGGSFPLAEDLVELIDRVGGPLVAAAYCPAVAHAAGEDPVAGVRVLGSRLESVKLRDCDGPTPVPLGAGSIPNRPVVEELERLGYEGWCTIEWDRLWLPKLDPPEHVLERSLAAFYSWITPPDLSERERRKFAASA